VAIRHRLVRVPVVLLTCFSLMLTVGAPVAAHDAPKLTVTVVSSPTSVTRGSPVSYVVKVKNTGWSSIDNVKLDTDAPSGFTFVSAITSKGTCSAATGGEATCSIGKLTAGAQAVLTLVFNTAPTTALGLATFKVSVRSGDGHSSWYWSGTTVNASATTTVLAVNPNATTHFIVPQGGEITTGGVTGSNSLSSSNPQGTTALVPGTPSGVPASVAEFGGATDRCPAVFIGRCFGQASTVLVANGGVLTPYLRVQVRFDKSEIPWWLWFKLHKITVIHWFDPYPTAGFEEISSTCSDSTPAQSELPCRMPVQLMPDHDLLITVFMESNGTIKGKG
jgi:uncharacterized repeat protein (TIGR01451 family)